MLLLFKKKKVFISHNSVDKNFCNEIFHLVTMLIGDDRKKIFYSSKAKYGVRNGANIIATMKEQYDKYNLFMIIASSPHYYHSPKSLNEMGAAWVLNSKCTLFMSPEMSIQELKGVIDASDIAIQIADNKETRDRLDLFAEDLTAFFHTKMPDEKHWEETKNCFIKNVINKTSTLCQEESKTIIPISESFKRKNDEKWLNDLFGYFSYNLMRDFINNGPEFLDSRIPFSYDAWCEILFSYTFILYDEKLKSLVFKFYELWNQIMFDNWKYYEIDFNYPHRYHFYGYIHDSDTFQTKEEEQKFRETERINKNIEPALRELANYIKNNYEVNLEYLSKTFEKEYQ